jgi:transcriptional regulator with XRE-family HTH domain
MTINDLAAAAGLSAVAISKLEAGKTVAALKNLRKFSSLLGLPVAYLGRFEDLPEDTLGQRINKARLCHGLTKQELARSVGVDRKTLYHWEMNRHIPLERYLIVLQRFLQVLER